MSDNLSNLLANLQGANLAHILEAINSPQPLTITDNARFAPVFNGPFPPRLVFPDENPNLRLLPNGWGGVAVGAWKMVPAPAKDPEEGEYNRMLRLMPMGYRRDLEGDDDGEEYEDEEEKGDGDENENENDDENDDDEDDDEEGGREVFSNGGTPWAPELEEEDFGQEEEEGDYVPELLLVAEEDERKEEDAATTYTPTFITTPILGKRKRAYAEDWTLPSLKRRRFEY